MKGLLERIKNRLKRYQESILFTKYRLFSKLHMGKYGSRKVIMFRLDMIGDCTMFTSTAKVICDIYNDREMTIVCLDVSRPVFERLGIFDRIITVDFKPYQIDYAKLKQLIKELRKDRYDILLQPQVSKYPVADILAAATKCNKRISIESKADNSCSSWVRFVNGLYDEVIPYPKGIVSEFDYYGAFVRGLGMQDYKTECPSLNYKEQSYVKGDYYVLYPGGSISGKFWPAERYARLVNYIYKKTNLIGVILGTVSERWVSDKVLMSLASEPRKAIVDLTGLTTMDEVIDIIGNARFVVSNDTSGPHIACATKTPCVVVAGGWHFGRFFPYHVEKVKAEDRIPIVAYAKTECYQCDWNRKAIFEKNRACYDNIDSGAPFMCIDAVSFETVRELVDEILNQT